MAWKLADGKAAVAYTGESNVVPVNNLEAGTPVGLINSITKREREKFEFYTNDYSEASIRMLCSVLICKIENLEYAQRTLSRN